MASEKKNRRVTPALVVAILALVAGLSGTAIAQISGNQLAPRSVGGGKLKPQSIGGGKLKPKSIHGSKLKQFTGGLIKRETIPAGKLAPNSLGTDQIDESKLGAVPMANRLSSGFNAKLAFGEKADLVEAGPFKLTAECVQNGTDASGTEGRDFVRILLETLEPGSVVTSEHASLTGSAEDKFLNPDTPEADRIVDEIAVDTGKSNFKQGGDFSAMAPGGAGLSATEGSTSAALNLFETGCAIQGTTTTNG